MDKLNLLEARKMAGGVLKSVLENDAVIYIRQNSTKIATAGVAVAAAFYLLKIWRSYGFFKRMGIKTPKYKFFFGHHKEILEKNYSEVLQEWTKTYGKTYGIYEGHVPILVTSDPDLIQEVFIKQFGNFTARKLLTFSLSDDDPRSNLFLCSRARWKRMRQIINPTFSTSKLKEMLPLVRMCSERFVSILEKKHDKDIVLTDNLRRYTMDILWNSAFGIDLDCQNNDHQDMLDKIDEIFSLEAGRGFDAKLPIYFSEFRQPILITMFLASFFLSLVKLRISKTLSGFIWLIQLVNGVIRKRAKEKSNRKDYVNILLESWNENVDESVDKKAINTLDKTYLEKKMTLDEIIANLIAFLFAGFGTTSAALEYCFHVLAWHPEQMTRLQSELEEHFGPAGKEELDYDDLAKLEYMDMFLKEVLRMSPVPTESISRKCTTACQLDGYSIPEGLTIAVDVLSLHFDKEHWGQDADEFNPLRFSPEIKRHPGVYIPFGLGPRTCVGMRFALMEIKLTLARVLMKYDVLPTPETPKKLRFVDVSGGRTSLDKVIIKLKPRNMT